MLLFVIFEEEEEDKKAFSLVHAVF